MEVRRWRCVVLWVLWVLLARCARGAESAALRCPPPPPGAAPRCLYRGEAVDEYFFNVDGNDIKIDYGARYFRLQCPENVRLDGGALPQLERAARVPQVLLRGCAPPAAGYAAALRALNVSVGNKLYLDATPPEPRLAARHFAQLRLTTLRITTEGLLRPDATFLEPLNELADLSLKNVKVTPSSLIALSPTIRSLNLDRSGVEELPDVIFDRLPALRRLVVRENILLTALLDGAKSLTDVDISAPLIALSIGDTVKNVVCQGASTGPRIGGCKNVVKLTLKNVTVPTVNAWLERCEALETVRVERAWGAGGGAGLVLRGARLRSLSVLASGLHELPPDWLAAVPKLNVLKISNNNITTLPRELFVPTTNLKELDLSNNKLEYAALEAVGEARSLEALALSNNPLGDLCNVSNAVSALWRLRRLRRAALARTGAALLCADWRRDLADLTDLDLRYNNFTVLQWDDLQWTRARASRVDLRGNPLTTLSYFQRDYRAALAAPPRPPPLTRIILDTPLQCDCEVYWFARALREAPAHLAVALDAAACGERRAGGGRGAAYDEYDVGEAGTPLRAVAPERLTCAVPAPPCPAGCACAVSGAGAVLRCARAGLAAPPALPPQLRPVIELDLAYNNITRIDVQDVPSTVAGVSYLPAHTAGLRRPISNEPIAFQHLNLSHNRIVRLDASVLGERREVWLEGNPLRCDCGLWAARARVGDWARVRCADGARPALGAQCAAPARPAPPAALLPALAALAVAAALAAALILVFVSSPNVRARIKRFLLDRGLCTHWASSVLAAGAEGWLAGGAGRGEGGGKADDDDGECEYDAFVSFAHADAAYAEALAARLEAGPHARRLCLHQRDWLPGELISDQIINSIHKSRRTIVLVSDAFAASRWARAECRCALALALRSRRPRLLLVLLPALRRAALARLHPALPRYAAAATYLAWDEPHFWRKLERAVPAAPAAPPAAPRY
ncbi:protein toll-like [Colias croceus]|uniref:protein toll-like n=1 Tax=Colias crocea TaxID=72248 RepID=UPI001E27B26B|nr:protein toll-like [Colias croceus]